ncbi:MAG: MATE family efflux transporter [Nitrospiraceae bacterium]
MNGRPTEPVRGRAGGPAGVWATIREALRGSQQDFTQVPIGRATILLAVPMVMEMAMESLFAVVDIFWVSKLGSDAIATVGLTESLLAMIYAVALGLSTAATAVVARRTGEKDPDGAGVAAVHIIAVSILVALVIGAGGALFGPSLLALMGASPSVVATGSGYAQLMLGGNITIVLLFVLNAIFRGAGDAATAMRSLWLANILNIVLGPCFIFGLGPLPEMGVTGAAVATTIGRGLGVVYQFFVLTRGRGRVTVRKQHVRADAEILGGLMRIAGNGTLQMLVETTSWLGLVRILSEFGSAALAGYTIATRVMVFALLPSWGMANAAATLVGQNLGAGKPDRAERSVWVAGLYNFVFLGVVGLALTILPDPIVGIFTSEASVGAYGVDCLRILAFGFLFYAYGMVIVQAFNGAGDTMTPMLLNLACFWVFKIPMAYLLAVPGEFGPRGVFVAVTVAYSVQTVAGILLFRRGRWKNERV